ncbi:hypothetical protein [uncultured Psychroserpens sp.]|uniref:hypothetical protein n=1 Tax=uncultured Psychroserpens sp. TaxID=255436 RepID=UPI002620643E|nr:hypothetical protein [uncultured Psychroserpens sp.]
MSKDTINDMFDNLKGNFDTEMPKLGHQKRFLDKLQQQNDTIVDTHPNRFNYWKPFLAVAASIILCFSIFTVVQQQEPELMDLASVSPELSQTQSFFTTAIEQELVALEAQRSPETEDMIYDALRELKVLEGEYQMLKIDLTESGNDKRVVYAMIANFQSRIDVLKTVLEHIEEVKNFKLNQNENTTTI